ncbi:MAG: histidine ammonia-lyase [Chloroflexi bacterium]|nr:MAG: histidine ammonia-lyase [Chloroflexota bacterium]
MNETHAITLDFYTLDDLRAIIENRPRLTLSPEVEAKIDAGAQFVLRKGAEDRYIYGVNTGFGSLCETRVEAEEMEQLQYNHVVSHAVGVGEIVSERISRLVMFIKLLTFRTGNTGISVRTVKRMLDFWNNDVIPTIPKKGTVGASGDLAPLAHMALPLLGLGQVHFRGEIVPADVALAEMGWEPIRLLPKEGLALTNGVQYINANAVNSLLEIEDFVKAADVLAALSAQAFSASETFYQAPYHQTSWHEERRVVAANLRRLLAGSNHFELPTCNQSKQDPYSFRCIPQVHGAVRQAFRFARDIIEKECNSVSDNPLFFPDQDLILFGGNLHGESTALALDFLAMATSELAYISERRTYQLLSGQRGLPDFLVNKPGLNSGFMIVQYTSAALVNENKVLCTPASIDTIPTCQLQEDHVSMGGTSAYKLAEIVSNCGYIFGNELLTAVQAIDFNKPLRLSPVTQEIVDAFRAEVSFLEEDRVMATDMETARQFFLAHKHRWATELGLA